MLLHRCLESVLVNCRAHFVYAHALRIIRRKQQIEIFTRLQLPFPFVLDRLNTVKLYQSLFDLVRSVASQYL